jgi:hypothetical protein
LGVRVLQSTLRASFLAASFALLTACPKGAEQDPGGSSIGSATDNTTLDPTGVDTTAGDGGVCLLHNCDDDSECAGCTEGRNSCYGPEKRCVACNPDTMEGCADGEECTEFGYCVPAGAVCPVDDNGEQTTPCNDDPDCAACDPLHQICSAGACVACRNDAIEACQATEQCVDNECVAKCPSECEADADCAACGVDTQQPATACFRHRCAECSDTQPGPAWSSAPVISTPSVPVARATTTTATPRSTAATASAARRRAGARISATAWSCCPSPSTR